MKEEESTNTKELLTKSEEPIFAQCVKKNLSELPYSTWQNESNHIKQAYKECEEQSKIENNTIKQAANELQDYLFTDNLEIQKITIDDIIKDLSNDKETLDVKDVCDFKDAEVALPKRVYKHGNVEIIDGIPKVRGPIVRCDNSGKKIDMHPDVSVVDVDSSLSESIAKNYGAANYESAVSAGVYNSYLKPNTDGLDSIIPDLDVKMFCNEDEISKSKAICNSRKDKIAEQINVIALYSIKDAKPFYYISSAEARIAIEYINMCRKFKTDIVRQNMDTIANFVRNIEIVLATLKSGVLGVLNVVWDKNFCDIQFDDEESKFELEMTDSNLASISRQLALPMVIGNNNVTFQRFVIAMPRRTIANAKNIICIHPNLNVLTSHIHYVICGKETIKLVVNDKQHIHIPNMTERETFGITTKYSTPYGVLPVFSNDKIDENSIVIVSKTIGKNHVVVSEYYMDKSPYMEEK